MGRTTTPTYRVHVHQHGYHLTPSGWDCRRDGRPSADALARYVRSLEASTEPGGCNSHLGLMKIATARIVHQGTGDVVARYPT